MDAESRQMVADTVRHVLAEHPGALVPAALAELGWEELCADEPALANGILFEEQGRAAAATTALGSLVASQLGRGAPGRSVVLPVADAPPGVADGDAPPLTVTIDGLAVSAVGNSLIVPVRTPDGAVTALVVPEGAFPLTPVAGLDPDLRLCRVMGTATLPPGAEGAGEDATGAWDAARIAAQRAIAHELIGLGRALLDQAISHVQGREQFGRPIGTFQAVKHRLAETHVALVSADAAVIEADRTGGEIEALLARVLASDAHTAAARHSLQVHGAIGFTWEHGLHRWIRRGFVLDTLFGTRDEVAAAVGRRLREAAAVPRLALL